MTKKEKQIEDLMTELKPCPFCGGEAVYEVYEVRKGYEATVSCCDCLSVMHTITHDTRAAAQKDVKFAWNRREFNK